MCENLESILHPCWLKGQDIKRIMSHKLGKMQGQKMGLIQEVKSNEVSRLRRGSSQQILSKIQNDWENLDEF